MGTGFETVADGRCSVEIIVTPGYARRIRSDHRGFSPSPLNGERVGVRGVNAIDASFKMVSTAQMEGSFAQFPRHGERRLDGKARALRNEVIGQSRLLDS
jgi:hypothetical protein